MAKKSLVILFLAAFVGVFLTVGLLTAADSPDEVTIHEKAFGKYKKGPVKLGHKKHNEEYKVKCAECHHVYKDGKNTWKEGDAVQKCGECHDPLKKKGKAAKLKIAFHKNCKTCHKEKQKGPFKKCNECHQKKV